MLKQNGVEFETINDNIPLNLSSILFVEADQELRGSRRLLLGVLKHPALAVSGYAVCDRLCGSKAASNFLSV
jgi:hypothetical protein